MRYAVVLVLLFSQSLLYCEVLPFEMWGEEYQHLNEKDWDTIKARFDKLLQSKQLITVLKNKKIIHDHLCLLGRVLTIEWQPERKKEVSEYFLKTALEMCLRPNYLEGSAPTEEELDKMGASMAEGHMTGCNILFLMLRIYGQFTNSLHSNELNQILKKCSYDQPVFRRRLRGMLLHVVRSQIQLSEAATLLKDWEKDTADWSAGDKRYITSLIRIHGYAAAESDEKAWEIFRNTVKPANEKLSMTYFGLVGENCLEITQTRNIDDPGKIFALAMNASSFLEKYCLVHAALTAAHSQQREPEEYLKEERFLENTIYPVVREMSQKIQTDRHINDLFGNIAPNHDPNYWQMKSYIESAKRVQKMESERLAFIEKVKREEQEKRVGTSQYVTMVPPEEQGEDFSTLDNASVLTHLLTAEEYPVQTKAAKILGDRNIAGLFKPNDDEQQKINTYVLETVLPWFKSDNPGDSGNARDQLARLWSLAVPSLLEAAKHNDLDNAYNALDALTAVRSEQVIQGLIDLYENSKGKENEQELKNRSIRSLGMLLNMRPSAVPYRPIPDSKDTKKLIDKIVSPFLRRISVKETDDTLHDAIKDAKDMLKNPADSRPKRVDGKPDEDEPAAEQDIHKQSVESEAKQGEKQAEGEPAESQPAKVLANERQDSLGLFPFIGGFAIVVLLAVVFYLQRKSRK